MPDAMMAVAIAVLCLAAIISEAYVSKKKKEIQLKKRLRETWGKVPECTFNSSLFAVDFAERCRQERIEHYIDNITWNDLDMDKIFCRLNNVQSTVGEEYLYRLLREPVFELRVLEERDRLIRFFQEHPDERVKLQCILASLGKREFLDPLGFFFKNGRGAIAKSTIYKILAGISVLAIVLMTVNLTAGIYALLISFAVNMTVYYRIKNLIGLHIEVMLYISRLVSCAASISKCRVKEIEGYCIRLSELLKDVKKLSTRSIKWFTTGENDIISGYLRIVFLGELIVFESVYEAILKNMNSLKEIYETVGFLDSMISIASYRESVKFYAIPKLYAFSASDEKKPRCVSFNDIYHPLIADPVTNTLVVNKCTLITGSNASGKSTFLKTIAINAVFAQTIYTCLAKDYSSCFFRIFSSMALSDNLLNNESYYIVEIKSLKRIFDNLDEKVPCLCIIDEVLRGTNTVERIAASSEVLHQLAKSNCLCIAATHDLELASILSCYYDNYHFQEYITDNGVSFDYKIYPGKSTTRNAIKLLKFMGYHRSIVERAEERAMKFAAEGRWDAI